MKRALLLAMLTIAACTMLGATASAARERLSTITSGKTQSAPRGRALVPIGKVRLPTLSYTVNKSGSATGEHPSRRQLVTVNYTLTLLDGTVVDSSSQRGTPDEFELNELIPAWQILLPLMRPGDDWTMYVPPEFGYGARAGKTIPGNSFLVFRVELISARNPDPAK